MLFGGFKAFFNYFLGISIKREIGVNWPVLMPVHTRADLLQKIKEINLPNNNLENLISCSNDERHFLCLYLLVSRSPTLMKYHQIVSPH